jgi:hypothetical protein
MDRASAGEVARSLPLYAFGMVVVVMIVLLMGALTAGPAPHSSWLSKMSLTGPIPGVKPQFSAEGFSTQLSKHVYRVAASPDNHFWGMGTGHIRVGGLLGGNTTSATDGDADPHVGVYCMMPSRGTLPIQLTLPASARHGVW